MEKAEIIFHPQNKKVVSVKGANLLQAAQGAFIDVESSCNGKGTCGKCLVQHVEGHLDEPHQDELKFLSGDMLSEGVRLACRVTVNGNATFKVTRSLEKKHRILSEGVMPVFRLDPIVRKTFLELPRPTLETNAADATRLEAAFGRDFAGKLPLHLLQRLPGLLRENDFKVTLVSSGDSPIGVEPGDTTADCYGAAVDVGTTTVVVSLINLKTGEETASATVINPQKAHGLDVLTRLQHAREHADGLEKLGAMVRNAVNSLIGDLCRDLGVQRRHIYEVAVAANSIMTHLFLGVDPAGLGKSPYIPAFTSPVTVSARDVGLEISEFGSVFCLPSVSGYIGSDIVAGLVASELHSSKEKALFIDIGTNGEIAMNTDKGIFACSCAAGPAFEGMNISCGMKAANGAVEKVFIEDDVVLTTIGQKPAIGLCGSGVIDAVGELIKIGAVAPSGRFVKFPEDAPKPPWARRLHNGAGPARFVLSEGNHARGDVAITQKDVRQVQLAKGAILSGILALTERLGITMADIERVYVGGAFGYHVRMESLARLGVLPKELLPKVRLIGNSSKSGAILCLLSREKRREAGLMARKVSYVELSCYPDYDRLFTDCLSFPAETAV